LEHRLSWEEGMDKNAIRDAYFEARGKWRGCEWPTSFGTAGLNLNGLKAAHALLLAQAMAGIEAQGWREAARWLEELELDVLVAEQDARTAVNLVVAGDLTGAVAHARQAKALEAKYRTPCVWRPFCEAVEAMAEVPISPSQVKRTR